MSKEQIDIIRDLLTEFDEMGFVPSTAVPNHEAYAIKWRAEITKALVDYFKQSEGEWYVNYMMSKSPSKRGRIIHYGTYTCSACGKRNGRKKTNYCPNCGAKMKGGVRE